MRFFAIAFFLLIACHNLTAQLCQGSLGDPIVNITFGAGGNPGPQLSAAATGYSFVSFDCPSDGSYTVRNNTNSCFGDSWHTLKADHTGDPNGYFMLVNASLAPSAFYVDTVRGLCGNTTYEFAAWVMNVLKQSACNGVGIEPNLTFSLENTDGTILKSYNTDNIPMQASPTWQQFGFFFTTPVSVSNVVLRIVNNAMGGCGNDIALDDITFRACGPQVSTTIVGNSNNTEPICQGTAKSVTFTSSVPPAFSNYQTQWQSSPHNGVWTDIPSATGPTLTQIFPATTPPGIFDYRVVAASPENFNSVHCRVASLLLFVQINPPPITSAVNSGPVCQNSTLVLTASGGTQYAWSGANNFTASGSSVNITNIQPTQAGKYYVFVTDTNGCTNSDSTVAVVNPAPIATVAFTESAICTGNNIQLISSGGGTYAWLPPTGLSSVSMASPVASPTATTPYTVTVTNSFACADTASIVVNVNEAPTANAGPDKAIMSGTSIKLLATATGQSVTYLWAPNSNIDDATILQPTVSPPVSTTYTLTVTSTNGCGTAVDSMHVFMFKGIYIPSAFSPNGDGINDTWKIPALAVFPNFQLSVFDRFGHIVFQNNNTSIPWDGTYKGEPVSPGTYVYIIDLKKAPGILKGTLVLVR